MSHHVVIIGGGFGGLAAARALRRKDGIRVTLIDRQNYHLFQPLLYQVASGGLSPANIAYPLRTIFKKNKNIGVLLGDVIDFDLDGRCVILANGTGDEESLQNRVSYDSLIIASGAVNHYFGNDDWEKTAPGLKTIDDAKAIRRKIFLSFERAERETDEARRRALCTFVVVGAGATGVELAGAIREIAVHTLREEFRRIQPDNARVLLVEFADRVLPPYDEKLSGAAERSLRRMGVEVRTGAKVTALHEGCVEIEKGGASEIIETENVLWAAGIAASPLAGLLADKTGTKVARGGRFPVEPNLTIPGHPEVFAIGDMTYLMQENEKLVPGVAPAAMQQGEFAARVIEARVRGRKKEPAKFRYIDRGSMATIGRAAAVAEVGKLRFDGYPAWLAWLFLHVMMLVTFQNRILVLVQWAWNYLTWSRSARLITRDGRAGGE
ncbi:MAG: NAD(P)/FAD-dependent oxidoreductase [Gemmatimonadetes bacterium]|nr:NAD(P)/FAD-dependent oxidoreductase [Gemmatimonadota bacterium]